MTQDAQPRAEPFDDDVRRAGLCPRCRHVQVIPSSRGARFYLCRLSFTDPHFARYPRIPVLSCPGYEPHQGGCLDSPP